jgi:hypothetical protein
MDAKRKGVGMKPAIRNTPYHIKKPLSELTEEELLCLEECFADQYGDHMSKAQFYKNDVRLVRAELVRRKPHEYKDDPDFTYPNIGRAWVNPN